jgi:hypothetical protein
MIRTCAGANSGGGGAVLSSSVAKAVNSAAHRKSENGMTQANRSHESSMLYEEVMRVVEFIRA